MNDIMQRVIEGAAQVAATLKPGDLPRGHAEQLRKFFRIDQQAHSVAVYRRELGEDFRQVQQQLARAESELVELRDTSKRDESQPERVKKAERAIARAKIHLGVLAETQVDVEERAASLLTARENLREYLKSTGVL
ncbi:MAG: hypothetical protein VX836_18350 [Pseudomonadota bacterium]|nr:hypothetical protein [Pseudomonadota bacterium]